MSNPLDGIRHIFFIGIAGTGMSALAQYLQGTGKLVAGSDRYFSVGEATDTRSKLEAEGIRCFAQDGSGINADTEMVVASAAVEESVPEMLKAKELNIPIVRRSELLAMISASKKTIAIGGTSGKSTSSALLFDIMEFAGMEPSIISGAGLVSLISEGKIGNAKVGRGDWLVIEADESDGSIVQYKPEMGVLLNIDKDHKEIEALLEIFDTFRKNCRKFIVNYGHPLARTLSQNRALDFSCDPAYPAGYNASDFSQEGMAGAFLINGVPFHINLPGRHNMENVLAAVAVSHQLGIPLEQSAAAVSEYKGIYRRHQVIGRKHGVWLLDDYAHNPAKCAASIRACQALAPKVIAWFQPHGYGPTRFLKNDFIKEISESLRPSDEIWMSEIFYAGGTATKDISANDIIKGIKAEGKQAFFAEDRNNFPELVKPHLTNDCVLLLMGARDPSLEYFAKAVWDRL